MSSELAYRIATLRRYYLHVLHGGVLSNVALVHTGGRDTPEAISALIQQLEVQENGHGL